MQAPQDEVKRPARTSTPAPRRTAGPGRDQKRLNTEPAEETGLDTESTEKSGTAHIVSAASGPIFLRALWTRQDKPGRPCELKGVHLVNYPFDK